MDDFKCVQLVDEVFGCSEIGNELEIASVLFRQIIMIQIQYECPVAVIHINRSILKTAFVIDFSNKGTTKAAQ